MLTVGKTAIPYRIRFSPSAKRRSVVVTPGVVEVVAPAGTDVAAAVGFAEAKRRWIFEKRTAVEAAAGRREAGGPERYASGAKVPYRGRRVALKVVRDDGVKRIRVEGGRGITVRAPGAAGEAEIAAAVAAWLKRDLFERIRVTVRRHLFEFGVLPLGITIKPMRGMWASCGKAGTLHFDPGLAEVPAPVLEYVVVHELAHLVHRSHSPAFWRLVATRVPGYREHEAWLAEQGRRLG